MVEFEILKSGGPPWQEQYGRMQRWYERLNNASRQRKKVSEIVIEDYYFAFFKECYHLKDWLKASRDKQFGLNLEKELDENTSMTICDHFANQMKHYILLPSKRRDKIKKIKIKRDHHLKIVADNPQKNRGKYTWTIIFDNQKIDGLALAKRCINFWDDTLKTYKFL